MNVTEYLKLRLNAADETSMTFFEWRMLMNGAGVDSNMEVIDFAIKTLNEETAGKADGFLLNRETGQLQLTSNGEVIPNASIELDLGNFYTKSEVETLISQQIVDASIGSVDWNENTRTLQIYNAKGEPVGNPVVISGGSGGGSSNNAVLTLTNTTGWLSKTVASNSECIVTANWSSIEDGLPTGDGVLSLSIGGSIKMTANVKQGDVELDLKKYLTAGVNSVKLNITDAYGNSRVISFSISCISLSLVSSFDSTIAFSGNIQFSYTPYGAVEKLVHFILDDEEIGSMTVTSSGREQSYIIPAQQHGSHLLRVYFEAVINGETVPSESLVYDLNCVVQGNNTVNIMSNYAVKRVEQFSTILIEHQVYDPANLTTNVTYWVNGEEYSGGFVDRTVQVWSYRPSEVGELILEIKSGNTTKRFVLDVYQSNIKIEAETQNLELYLSSDGRSNIEENPDVWTYQDIETEFFGFNWISDGWQLDNYGNSVLRVSGDARIEIPFKIFANDFRTTGKTIEVEFSSRDVLDYDATILSSFSEGRGIQITAQRADMYSEQTQVGTQYKEDEHVRLSFVVQKRSGNRLVLIYLNGILSGIKQYPDNDDFSQGTSVGLSIGSNDCTIDLYNIRIYGNDLTRYQILDNWIADTQDINEKLARYERNQIYDSYGTIVKEKLPSNLPYLVLEGPVLPNDKGDKKPIAGYYVDPLNEQKSFDFTGAEIDVQGTSSKDYYVKNYKIKFKNGFVINNTPSPTYKLRDTSIPTDVFTFKADVASSEGANNVELVRLYNDITPHKTPPQIENNLVRQGIDGLPCVVFWDNGSSMIFLGKYNFNNDKSTEEVFGFTTGDESWEIRNNVSDRVMFKSADFSDSSSETGWLNDFEGRYPDGNTDCTNLAAFVSWVVSTDRTAATNSQLSTPVTYEETEYTHDTSEYRLKKFKYELPNWGDVTSAQFYWLFTEFFLMVDSRAKNAFPTRYSDGLWCWLPYDMDTAIGINNEGALAFDYSLEDTDYTESGAQVFNGQQSVFWNNVRDAFWSEIKQMYIDLRKDGKLTYEGVMSRFNEHQSIWPEAIMNEDAFRKYIEPYEVEGATMYFSMGQGKKELQRTWWLYNRFRYYDAKCDAGDIASDRILIRIYSSADIPITPYADTYLRSKYGSYTYEVRAKRGQEYTLNCYVDAANDLETTIFPASLIAEIADLSGLKIGLADFSKAVKLQRLKIGDGSSDYSNGNLTELTLGNNTLLRHLDVRNCPNLTMAVDLSGCSNIEEVYFDGSSIAGVSLPNGGMVKTLHLPGTITNLTVLNQNKITDFVLPSYSQITTLRIENSASIIPTADILSVMPVNSRVRLIGLDWTMDDADAVLALYDRLDQMRGLDENGNNVDKAQVSGTLHIDSLTGAELAEMQSRYPYIKIEYQHIASYCRFYSQDGSTLLYTAECLDGADAVYAGSTPSKTATAQYTFSFVGWNTAMNATSADANALKAVTADRNVYAAFSQTVRTYTVYFYNGSTLLQTVNNVPYGGSATYTGSTPTYTGSGGAADYEYTGFQPTGKGITGNTSCYAQFRYTGYVYTQLIDGSITEYVDDELTTMGEYAFAYCNSLTKVELPAVTSAGQYGLYYCSKLEWVDFGTNVNFGKQVMNSCNKLNTLILRGNEMTPASNSMLNNSGITYGYIYVPAALVDTYKAASGWSTYASQIRAIEDYPEVWAKYSWEMVNYRIQKGDYASYYAIGDLIPLDMGSEGQINMQIAAFDADDLADGSGKAHISFISKELLKTSKQWNPSRASTTDDSGATVYTEGTGTIGGWEKSELRTYYNDTLLPLIPEAVRDRIVSVTKTQTAYDTAGASFTQTTEETVWLPSYPECFNSGIYTGLFTANSARIKYKVGASSAAIWWLRSAGSATLAHCVSSNGSMYGNSVNVTNALALGFCI